MSKIDSYKRDSIIEAAYGLFVRKGLEKTSIRDITNVLDININTLYYYFRTKAEIVICCVEYGLNRISNELFNFASSGNLDDEKFLLQILTKSLSYKEELCWCYQVITSPNYNWLMQDIVLSVRKKYERKIDGLAQKNKCNTNDFKLLMDLSILIIKDYAITEDKYSKKQFVEISTQIKKLIEKSKTEDGV